jgi:hypothetical protein
MMDELEMQELLQESLAFGDEQTGEQHIKRILTFERAGLLTRNRGLVLTMADGSEFQITIVQSKLAEDEEEEEG